MELGSVRELKQSLTDALMQNLAATVRTRAAFGTAAQPMTALSESPSTLALGVAPHLKGKGFRLAVRVQHRALENGPEVELIRQQAGNEVDVRYIGALGKRVRRGDAIVADVAPWHQLRQRPLLIGSSIGHVNITAGTLGAFVRGRSNGTSFILSNNHVLANENKGRAGDAIVQQGKADGGQDPSDAVGQLGSFIRIKRRGINFLDCALSTIFEPIETRPGELFGVGQLAGLGNEFLDEGTQVQKIGRTTGHTRGRITAFELDNLVIGYDMGNVRFDNQIEIEGVGSGPFSQGGDSGSLIFDDERRGVALLFAGGDQGGANGQGLTYANPLRGVLDALEVDLSF